MDDTWISQSCLLQGIEIVCIKDNYFKEFVNFIPLINQKIDAISACKGGENYVGKDKKRLGSRMLKIIKENLN